MGSDYEILERRLHSQCVDIYLVKCRSNGRVYEAQSVLLPDIGSVNNSDYDYGGGIANSINGHINGLRRRMRRISRSSNFIVAFDEDDRHWLVSDIQRSQHEWEQARRELRAEDILPWER